MNAVNEAKALRGALNYSSPIDVLRDGDKLMGLVPWLKEETRRVIIGCAFQMGIAEGKRKERARRRKAGV